MTSFRLPPTHAAGIDGPATITPHATIQTLTCLCGLSDGSIIDGAQRGNATRHVNHACMPNVEAVERYADNDELELVVSAIRRIRFGELVRCSPASVGQKAASV